ncbi:MAG TPA: ATP-binding protein [Candidatus Dormibacteraeota bacterium]|nr:ATP-binding protein [Candidatus Dormibacteraeota bacterium]
MRRNLFWKLAFTFLALLLAVLLSAGFFAERSLRRDYERTGFQQLAAIAHLAQQRPFTVSAIPPATPKEFTALKNWVAFFAASGARVTVVMSNGAILADSLTDAQSQENLANRPEIIAALRDGEGRSLSQSATLNRELLYFAFKQTAGNGSPVVVRFALPIDSADEVLGSFRRSLWLSSLFILIVSGGVTLFASQKFSNRIDRLLAFSGRVAEGDFRPLPSDGSSDALESLRHSLNLTAARLDRSIQTLTEERNLSSAILGSMVEGVAVVNSAERLVFSNQGFAEILGLDIPPESGKALVEVVRQAELLEAVRVVLAGEPRVEAEVVTGTLRVRYFAATVAAVRAGETSGAVIVLHDITELRKLERIRRDFVANVSHEFRTPLTAIQGFAETLLAGAVDDPQNRGRFLEIIVEHSRRLARLTEDLLKLSKMDADRLELEIGSVSVSQLIESCYETAQRRAAEKDLRLSLKMPPELPDISGDARRLAEVLQNLLDNAIQYTLPGGEIILSAEATGTEVVFTVSDTGIGIPLADQSRIFERFYRVDAARSREAGGTGLGLAIAKHLIEVHEGRLWVESEMGEGSAFHFSVPIFDPERAALRASVTSNASTLRSALP